MSISRRETLAALGTGAAVAALSGVRALQPSPVSASLTPVSHGEGEVIHQPLPYVRLDPVATAERAYGNHYRGDCMYGVFAAVVEELAEKVGEPYRSYPTTVTRYGAGGVAGWATLCGAANGAAMVIYLVSKDPGPATDEVFAYYGQSALPDYRPRNAKFDIPASTSESTLCHVSVSKWCEKSGKTAFSPERTDRCGQLVASVAKKTVEVLNAQFDGTFVAAHPLPESVRSCRGCHDKGGELENARGKETCGLCHPGMQEGHP